MAKKANGAALRRTSGTRALAPILIVACEGKTEWHVLDSIRRSLRIRAARVVIAAQCGDPLAVVKKAMAERQSHERLKLVVSHCFAVFDRDEHPRYEQAKDRAASESVSLGISNPCVELWLLWLVQDQTASLTRVQAQRLCQIHPGYDHDRHPFVPSSALSADNILAAGERARRQTQRHVSAGDPVDTNPSSSFGDVVVALLEAGKQA